MVLALFGGCTEKADLDPKEKRVVVVECILMEDAVQRLYLNFSSLLNESHYQPVEEAEAFIDEYKVDGDDSTRVARYAFSKVSDGKWESAFSPKVEHIYKLNVDVPGYPLISARTKISRGNFSVGLQSPLGNIGGSNFDLKICQPDEKPEHGYGPNNIGIGLCHLTISGSLQDKEKVDISDSSAFWIYGMDFNPVSNKFEIAEYIYSCHPGADKFNLSDKKGAQLPQLQKPDNYDEPDYMDCLEYGLPMYFSMIHKYCNVADELFNIRYIRIPASVFRTSDLDNYDHYRYGEDQYSTAYHIPTGIHKSDGASYTPSFRPYYEGIAHPYAHIVVEQVSSEYDKYMKDILGFHYGLDRKTEKDELTHLYEYRDIYTNIINGTGIFGWSKRRMQLWAHYSCTGSKKIIHNGHEVNIGITNKNHLSDNPNEINRIIKEYYRKYGDPNIR